jgi:hypothetical protein
MDYKSRDPMPHITKSVPLNNVSTEQYARNRVEVSTAKRILSSCPKASTALIDTLNSVRNLEDVIDTKEQLDCGTGHCFPSTMAVDKANPLHVIKVGNYIYRLDDTVTATTTCDASNLSLFREDRTLSEHVVSTACHKSNEALALWVPQAQSLAEEQRMPKKYWLQLEKFDGNNMPFETFLAKLENCSRYNGWTERDQLGHLQASLTHGAAQCLWDVGESHRDSLYNLLALLKSRFGSEGQAEKYCADLRARRRRSGETLQSLYQDIRRLMVLVFPGPTNATTEIVGRYAFLDGLNDGSLALRIRENEPNTMEEALRVAVRFEAYEKVDETDASQGVKSRL